MSRSSPEVAQKVEAGISQRRGKNTRTQIACDACKKRRTKCSGVPGPCSACSENGIFCHFHPRMDSRRKECMKPQDHAKERRQLMCGLLLALRHNPEEEIRDLLRIIRDPTLSAPRLAKTIQRQLHVVSNRTGLSTSNLTEDDILSLALADMLGHKTNTTTYHNHHSPASIGQEQNTMELALEPQSASSSAAPSALRAQEWVNQQHNQSWDAFGVLQTMPAWDIGSESYASNMSQSQSTALNLSPVDFCGPSFTWDGVVDGYLTSVA